MKTNNNSTLSKFGQEFETRFIVALLNDRIFFERIIDIVKPKYFDNSVYQWVVENIRKIYVDRKIVPVYNDLEIIADEEKNNEALHEQILKELSLIRSLQINMNLSIVKEKALQFCKNQEMKSAVLHIVDLMKSEDYDGIRKTMDNALKVGEDRILGHDYFEDVDYRFTDFRENVVPTDWELLNKVMNGGLAAGEIGSILAGPSVGKSTMFCNLGLAALKRGKTVLHYTFEISAAMVGLKYDALIADMMIDDITKNPAEVKEKLAVFKEKTNSKLIIQQYPTKTPTILSIRTHIQRVITKGHLPDLIIVDYADLIKVDGKHKEKRHELEDIYEQLRSIAGELKCAVWTASQVNRAEFENEIIGMTGFAESWAKAHVSDFVLSLSRDMKASYQHTGTAFVAKNRIGPSGGIYSMDVDMSKAFINLREYDSFNNGNKSIRNQVSDILKDVDGSAGTAMLSRRYKQWKNTGNIVEK